MSKTFYRIVGGLIGCSTTVIALCLWVSSDWGKKVGEHAGALINASVAVLLWPMFLAMKVCDLLPFGLGTLIVLVGLLVTVLWMPALGVWAGGTLKRIRNRRDEHAGGC